MTKPEQREYDIVILGATGFVGRLTAGYLATAPNMPKVALAGRSEVKLREVREIAGTAAADWPVLIADVEDRSALESIATSARVIINTVGPYRKRHGLNVVEACAAAGTHYIDLAGEVLFIRESIDRAHAVASSTGARIVHVCGFDSIPPDLGVLLLHEHAAQHNLGDLEDTTLVLLGVGGGVSGGSVDSLRSVIDDAKADSAARSILEDPYALSPNRIEEPDLGDELDTNGVVHDRSLGGYLTPFAMGPTNTRTVRRSNALSGYAYGRRFKYRELMLGGKGPLGTTKATVIAGARVTYFAALSHRPTRRLLNGLLPNPGEGPSAKKRDAGFAKIEIHTRTDRGVDLLCRIEIEGDPGYRESAVMLGESALALAFDEPALPSMAGVLTPATGLGLHLVERLRAAGHKYEVTVAHDSHLEAEANQ